jgi:hypothetical protein
MKRTLAALMMVLVLSSAAVVAHAERGDIGGVGVRSAGPGTVKTNERGDIGTIKPTANPTIWPQ